MTMAIAFWVLMLIWLVWITPLSADLQNRAPWGGNLLIFILLALLGWHVFGAAITR